MEFSATGVSINFQYCKLFQNKMYFQRFQVAVIIVVLAIAGSSQESIQGLNETPFHLTFA